MSSYSRVLAALVLATSLAGAAQAAGEKPFLTKALKGDNSEMALGQMAAARGQSQGTRAFGRMLHEDHAAAKLKTLPVAQAHGVGDTNQMAQEARVEQQKLHHLHGRAFDREFARYMVKDHRKDIANFERQTRTGDATTAALARDTLPDLRKHLATAERLLKTP